MHPCINVAQEVVICLTKKMIIALADQNVLLNKKTELISKCCHGNKFIFEQSQIKIV